MRKYIPFVAIFLAFIALNEVLHPFDMTRLFGVLWVGANVYFCFTKELPVHLGNHELGRLKGWSKAWVIVPMTILGVLIVLYAPEVACMSRNQRYLCA